MAGHRVTLTGVPAGHEGEDERAFMQRVLVDSTATGAALSGAQRGYLVRWHRHGWWTYDGMSLRNGHLTEDGRTALHERVGGLDLGLPQMAWFDVAD